MLLLSKVSFWCQLFLGSCPSFPCSFYVNPPFSSTKSRMLHSTHKRGNLHSNALPCMSLGTVCVCDRGRNRAVSSQHLELKLFRVHHMVPYIFSSFEYEFTLCICIEMIHVLFYNFKLVLDFYSTNKLVYSPGRPHGKVVMVAGFR